MQSKASEEKPQCFEPNKHQCRGNNTYAIHASTYCQPDSCRSPYSSGCGQSTHYLLLQNYGSGTNETDAAYHLCGYTTGVETHQISFQHILKSVLRNYHHERTTQSDKEMSAVTGFLGTILSLQTYQYAHNPCHEYA